MNTNQTSVHPMWVRNNKSILRRIPLFNKLFDLIADLAAVPGILYELFGILVKANSKFIIMEPAMIKAKASTPVIPAGF